MNDSSRRRRRPARRPERAMITLLASAVLLVIVVISELVGRGPKTSDENRSEAPPANPGQPVEVANPPADVGAEPDMALVAIPGGYAIGSFRVYFTEPINTEDESRMTGSPVEQALVDLIGSAQQSIDMAVFEFNSAPVKDALIQAHERGVNVRVVTDGDAGLEDPEALIPDLELAGIPVVSDELRGGLMHDKFFVVDSQWVWTGSTNITRNGLYNNNNNSILVHSPELAQDYAQEFEELFAGQFGKTSSPAIAHPVVTVDGAEIETFFESEGDVAPRLAALIQNATSVRFMAFSFTESLTWTDADGEHSLMDLLVSEANNGLDVQGIVEASSRRFVRPMVCAGLDVRQDGNPDVFHHKVFIIDGSIVVTGSFNFSASAANDNDENLLVIHNPALARAYLEEFQGRWAQAVPMPADAFVC